MEPYFVKRFVGFGYRPTPKSNSAIKSDSDILEPKFLLYFLEKIENTGVVCLGYRSIFHAYLWNLHLGIRVVTYDTGFGQLLRSKFGRSRCVRTR